MQKTKFNTKNMTIITIVMGIVAVITIVVFIVCINWILQGVETRGRESLEIFAEQTSLRLEDMLETRSSVMQRLKFDIGDEASPTVSKLEPLLQNYMTTWEAFEVGLLFEDETAVGADGAPVDFAEWVNPISVDGYAYKVRIISNVADGESVLTFAVYDELTIDGKKCIGFFMNYPISTINEMMVNTQYGKNQSTFISLIDNDGNTLWRSDADTIAPGIGNNMYEDLQEAKFESSGEFDRIKQRLDLNLSGTAVYKYAGEKIVLAYVPLQTNYWKLVIGMQYDEVISQSGNNWVVFILISALAVLACLLITFYFIYRQRRTLLSKQLAEAEATKAIGETKAKSDFLSRMSHELRTPLNGIVGMIELVSRYGDDKEKRDEYMSKIKDSSEYLVSLINDILDVSKIENNKIVLNSAPFNIKELCQSLNGLFSSMSNEKKIDFVMDDDGMLHDCFIGDEMRIKQIVVNLLSNAVKFTDEGNVKCTFREYEVDGKTSVEVKVEDTGRGISPEYIERIFYPFEQENTTGSRNQTGTGLGLAICVNLVKLSGGTITVDSKVGEGSIFTVILPLEPSESEVHSELNYEPEKLRLDGINILLAEDNTLNARIATALLNDAGATVTLAKNGVEACEMFDSSKSGEFNVILMDIQMPEMDGIEATKTIRASDHPDAKSIPIIAMTANALSEDRDMAIAAGMNDHLSKPIYIAKMCRVILLHCDKK